VIYTPWSNLKKDGSMATGQVGFKDNRLVKRVYVEKRENAIVNRLNKTKVEKHPDLREEKAQREKELRKVDRIAQQEKVGRPCVVDISRRLYGSGVLTGIPEEGRCASGGGAAAAQVAEGAHV